MNMRVLFLLLLITHVLEAQNRNLILPFDEDLCMMDYYFIKNILIRDNLNCIAIYTVKTEEDKFTTDYVTGKIQTAMQNKFQRILREVIVPIKESERKKSYSINTGYSRTGGVLITKNMSLVNALFVSKKSYLHNNPIAEFVTILYDECGELSGVSNRVENIFREIWLRTGIMHIILVVLCADGEELCLTSNIRAVLMFDPFHYNSQRWGHMFEIDYMKKFKYLSNFDDLKGYPIKISQFKSTMVVLKKKQIARDPDEYWGMDVEFANTISKAMNFTPVYVQPDGDPYGFRLANGSFTGTLQDLLESRSDMSLVGSFIKDYGSPDLEFTSSISSDELCLVVSKAKPLPGWLILSKCFTPGVWIYILVSSVITSTLYVGFVNILRRVNKMLGSGMKIRDDSWYKQTRDIMSVLFSRPIEKLPHNITERIFITSCMLWSLTVIIGAFQGSLTNAYTTPAYYPDIDTLEDLDRSGFSISLTSAGLINDLFGNEPKGTVSGNLRNRIHIMEKRLRKSKTEILSRGNIAFVERFFNIEILSMLSLRSDGGIQIHRLSECPRNYNIAYLFPKNSALLPKTNLIIQRLLQGGIGRKWYRDTRNMLLAEALAGKKHFTDSKRLGLTLGHLQLAFILWLSGLAISTVKFIFELRGFKRPKEGVVYKGWIN